MQNFEYYNPTRLIFGRGEIASLTRHIPEGVRVLVTFGGGSVKRNGVYDQVKAALAGIDHVEFWGIEANPKVETLRKCIEFGREQKAGFILAVGGGSVLDGSKLVACALTEGETRDAWDIVLSRRPARCIPYASVMTLPATGSEMNANSVISRLETKEKLAFVAPENPRFSILDPECCRSLGAAQVAASLADITAHVLEQYMTEPGQSRPMDRWAEGLLLTLVDIAPELRTPEPDYDVLADYMLTATLGLNDMICMGVNQDWATHAIGHEITALTGMAHGATLAIVFPALLRVLIDTKEAKLVQMGERVFDVHYGTDRERALETIVRLEAFFASLGLPTRLDEAGVGEDVEREIVRRFNELYGETLVEPTALLPDNEACLRLPGTDGKAKMSKSLGNCIYLADDPDDVRTKVMGMYTDPNHLQVSDPGNTKENPVFLYLDAFCTDEHFARYLPEYADLGELKAHYERGGLGDVKVKKFLNNVLQETLEPIRTRRQELAKDPAAVMEILRKGSYAAQAEAAKTLDKVKHAMKIDYFA